jgi:predicted phage terminase large subunit-like protein
MINISTQDLKRYIYNQVEKKTIEKARNDFKTFCQLITKKIDKFNIVNLNQDWIDVVVEDFEELLNSLHIHRGIYNIPPRTGKTTLLTTFGSAFLLGIHRNLKIGIINANQDKLNEINKDIKDIINSTIYRQIFNVKDIASKNAVRMMRLDNGGSIVFKVSGSNVIGSGYHFLFFDDYLNPNNEKSQARKEQAKLNLSAFLSRKEYEPKTKVVIIEQRIGFEDTTAICKEKWDSAEIPYNHISLPYYFDKEIIIRNKKFKEDTYLDIKFNTQDKKEITTERGIETFETQYQQNPTRQTGVILPFDYVNHRYEGDPSMLAKSNTFRDIIISADTSSGKNKNTGDNSCFTVAGLRDGDIYVLEVVVGKFAFHELKNVIEILYFKYKPNYFFIEDKSSGESLIQEFKNKKFVNPTNGNLEQISIIATMPKASKEDRLEAVKYFFANGKVKIPEQAKWVAEWQYELSNFPNTKHDDRVDSITHLLLEVKKRCLEVPSVVIYF